MNTNSTNIRRFQIYKSKHIDEGGKAPDEYAITQLIKDSITNKDYILYNGGGPHDNKLKKYDVVVNFELTGDPFFGVVMDHDGDFCDIYSCNNKGQLIKKMH